MSFEEQPEEDHSECKRAYETAIAEIAAKAQTEWAARNEAEKRASAYKAEMGIVEARMKAQSKTITLLRKMLNHKNPEAINGAKLAASEQALLEAQARIYRIRGVIGDAGFMEADCAECRRNMDIVSRALSDSSSSPAALQAALAAARAEAFRDAAEEVYRSGWNDAHERGNLRDHSQALKDILMARARSPSPSATTGEEPRND